MQEFSEDKDHDDIGKLVLEILLNSSIDTITALDLSKNGSWFKYSHINLNLLFEFFAK